MDTAVLLALHPATLYVAFLLAPFVQEDAAVFGAAAASAAGDGDPAVLFAAILIGLTASDLWKYGLGRLAPSAPWLARWTAAPAIETAKQRVLKHLGIALLIVRLVPGTRIATYVACGAVGAPFVRFSAYLVLAGAAYAGVVFLALDRLGAAFGDQIRAALPAIALTVLTAVIATALVRRAFKLFHNSRERAAISVR